MGHLTFETESYSEDAHGQGLEKGPSEGKGTAPGGAGALDTISVTSGSVGGDGGGGSVTKGDGTGDSVGENTHSNPNPPYLDTPIMTLTPMVQKHLAYPVLILTNITPTCPYPTLTT